MVQAGTIEGRAEIVEQLVAGLAVLQFLENFDLTPAGVLASGVVDSNNQTYREWADKLNLPLFTNYSLIYQNGNAQLLSASILAMLCHIVMSKLYKLATFEDEIGPYLYICKNLVFSSTISSPSVHVCRILLSPAPLETHFWTAIAVYSCQTIRTSCFQLLCCSTSVSVCLLVIIAMRDKIPCSSQRDLQHCVDTCDSVVAAAQSGPAQFALAAQKLNADRNYLPGMIRTLFQSMGKQAALLPYVKLIIEC